MVYKLINKKPVIVSSLDDYSDFMKTPDNYIVDQSLLRDIGVVVSTVFTGFSLEFNTNGTPLLFETVVYETLLMKEVFYKKYGSYKEAKIGHNLILNKIHKNNGIDVNCLMGV